MAVVDYARPLTEIDLPEPELLPGHALVEVETCGVCFSDVKTSRGEMPFSAGLALPHVPGHEACGRVLETSPPGVLEPGTLVVVYHYWPCGQCRRCRAGEESLCADLRAWLGFTEQGAFRERLVVPLERLFEVPDGIDPFAAASLTCAVGTAYRATVTRGGVRPGGSAAVIGLGGVGIHALQIAVASGAQAVGLDVSERSLEVAQGLGLVAVDAARFDRRSSEIAQVAEEGFDVVIVTAGAESAYRQAREIVRKGGRIVAVGYAMPAAFSIATPELVLGEVEVAGSRYVSRDELGRAIELVRSGRVRTVVDSIRPLEQVNEAFDDLMTGKIVGRVVLQVADGA